MIKYLDPYKEAKYGKLKGDKSNESFKVEFKEGKFYKVDDGYVFIADVTKFHGVARAYKPEEPLNSAIVAIPIYNKEYEIWIKKDGKSEPQKIKPSIHEVNLCGYLDFNHDPDKYYQGAIAFLPDFNFTNLTNEQVVENITRNCQLTEVEPTGNLPNYEPPSSNSYKKSNYSKLTPLEKLKWLKTELCSSINDHGCNEEMSLIDLVSQLVNEQENESVLAIYTDLVKTLMN